MKKRFTLFSMSIAVVLIVFTACEKEINTPQDEEIPGTPPPGLVTYCRIESLWENPHAPNQRFFLVLYDQYENPTAVTTPLPTTGHPYRIFRYDGWHRLREYIGDYGNGFFEFWHRYGFDNNGRIGVDTNYVFGKLGENPTEYFDRRISKIEYDSQGRIIKVTTTSMVNPTPMVETYSYDSNGNLIVPGVTYDNKTNLNTTNDIWQFLNRDYSRNNPFMADAYNGANLPTVINSSSTSPSMLWLGEVDLHHSQIGYSCRDAHW